MEKQLIFSIQKLKTKKNKRKSKQQLDELETHSTNLSNQIKYIGIEFDQDEQYRNWHSKIILTSS